jgi:hypothetical protein
MMKLTSIQKFDDQPVGVATGPIVYSGIGFTDLATGTSTGLSFDISYGSYTNALYSADGIVITSVDTSQAFKLVSILTTVAMSFTCTGCGTSISGTTVQGPYFNNGHSTYTVPGGSGGLFTRCVITGTTADILEFDTISFG